MKRGWSFSRVDWVNEDVFVAIVFCWRGKEKMVVAEFVGVVLVEDGFGLYCF